VRSVPVRLRDGSRVPRRDGGYEVTSPLDRQPDRPRRRVLVTGVAGFLGSHLAEALLDDGDQVVGVDAFIDSYPRWHKERNLLRLRQSDRFAFTELDLRTDPLDEVLEGVDVVVNEAAFAGLPRSWHEVDTYVACNLLAVSRLVDACRRHGVGRFVQASTSSVYGERAVGDEQEPTRPISPYGVSKLAAEGLLLSHVRAHGFPAVILRYFSIYGPRQRPDMAYRIFTEAMRRAQPITVFGDGRQSRSNTFVSDAVAATVAATQRGGVGEVYNVGGGVELELREAIEVIANELGCHPEVHHLAERAGDQRTTRADVSKARDALGYVPRVDPYEGLAAQVRWHVEAEEGDRGRRFTTDLGGRARATPLIGVGGDG
jgi:UDP-glucuronate 4-epimerase